MMNEKTKTQTKHVHLGKSIFKLFCSALGCFSETFPLKTANDFAIKSSLL